jgi:hypothetical protein
MNADGILVSSGGRPPPEDAEPGTGLGGWNGNPALLLRRIALPNRVMAHATDQARREERLKSSPAADGLAPSEPRSARQAYKPNHPGERRGMKSLFAPLARFI